MPNYLWEMVYPQQRCILEVSLMQQRRIFGNEFAPEYLSPSVPVAKDLSGAKGNMSRRFLPQEEMVPVCYKSHVQLEGNSPIYFHPI